MIICVDIETTGLDPHSNQILQIAAVALNPNNPTDLWFFERTIKWTHLTGHIDAIVMNTELLQDISERQYTDIDSAIEQFNEWLDEIPTYFDQEEIVFAGFNIAGLDVPFLRAAGLNFDKISHRYLEVGSLYGTIEGPAKSKEFLHLANKYPIKGKPHQALFDAKIAAYAILEKFDYVD